MASETIRLRARPARMFFAQIDISAFCLLPAAFESNRFFADTPGTTILSYTPDGRRVITAGSNSAIRIYTIGEDGEPMTVDEGVDGYLGIAATVCFCHRDLQEWHLRGQDD